MVIAVMGGIVVRNWLERRLIYFPSTVLQATPAEARLAFEDVALTSEDGTSLHAWFIPAPAAAETRALLYYHGNAGNIGDRVLLASQLRRELRLHLLLVDYRGYGRSEGTPSEEGLYQDGVSALHWLRARPEVEQVVLLGHSLGGGVATEVARRERPEGLILASAFTSIPAMAKAAYGIPPFVVATEFNNEAKIGELDGVPLLVAHGDGDEIIPYAMGEALAHTAGVSLLTLPGAHHNDIWDLGGSRFYDAMRAFIAESLAPPKAPPPAPER